MHWLEPPINFPHINVPFACKFVVNLGHVYVTCAAKLKHSTGLLCCPSTFRTNFDMWWQQACWYPFTAWWHLQSRHFICMRSRRAGEPFSCTKRTLGPTTAFAAACTILGNDSVATWLFVDAECVSHSCLATSTSHISAALKPSQALKAGQIEQHGEFLFLHFQSFCLQCFMVFTVSCCNIAGLMCSSFGL